MKRNKYTEPDDYFPKKIRKENKLGEFSEEDKKEKSEKRDINKKFRDYVNGKD